MAAVWQWQEDRAQELWRAAREYLNAAQLLALPTETFYALAAHPFQDQALAQLFELKRRTPDKPVLLLVSGPDMVPRLARDIPRLARKLMARFWPGPLVQWLCSELVHTRLPRPF